MMAKPTAPSYTDITYNVFLEATELLTIDEVFAAVNARRPVTSNNPRKTIQSIVTANLQYVNVGNRRYGFLPRLVNGSVLRMTIAGNDETTVSLKCPEELRDALWPSSFGNQKRRELRPIQMSLPNGEVATIDYQTFSPFRATRQPALPDNLLRYLADQQAQPGDALIIRIVDGVASLATAHFESQDARDDAAFTRRNQTILDEVEDFLRDSPQLERRFWEIAVHLIVHGMYHDPIAPDSLVALLEADKRFESAGFGAWMLAEAMTPERRFRIQMVEALVHSFDSSDTDSENDGPTLADIEIPEALRYPDLNGHPGSQKLDTNHDSIIFFDQMLLDVDAQFDYVPTALDRAQDLIYESWKAPSKRKRIRLVRKALEISPDCADAYFMLAEETAHDASEAAELYSQGVAAGERALGPEVFASAVGNFWGILETRPYMRALGGLADALWALNRKDEAIAHAWEMLRLNPGDNQGMRYHLLHWLLQGDDDASTRRLLDQYDDASAVWQYGQALHAYRTSGASLHANLFLAEARKWNPLVPPYLLGTKRLPQVLPDLIGMGDESEAVYCAATQLPVWQATDGALTWLRDQTT